MKKIISLVIAVTFIAASSLTGFAYNEQSVSRITRDSVVLDNGILYSYVGPEKVLVYAVYENGQIEYSVNQKNNPLVAETGNFAIPEYEIDIDCIDTNLIESIILNRDPDRNLDFSNRSYRSGMTEEQAINYARSWFNSQYGSNSWETGVTNSPLGGGVYQGVSVTVTKNVAEVSTEEGFVYYFVNDSLTSLLSTILSLIESRFRLTLADLLGDISWIIDATGKYVASANGTFSVYSVTDSRVKFAKVSNMPYYIATWEIELMVHSGGNGMGVKEITNRKDSDYNNNVGYFVQKAALNYLND